MQVITLIQTPAAPGLGKELSFLISVGPEVQTITGTDSREQINPTAKILKTQEAILVGKFLWRSLGLIPALTLSVGMTLTVLLGQVSPCTMSQRDCETCYEGLCRGPGLGTQGLVPVWWMVPGVALSPPAA